MSRYIDADAMKKWIDEYVSEFKKSYNKDIEVYIDYQPSIDIVRCRECKHRGTIDCLASYYDDDWGVDRIAKMNDDDFCSYGVKKGADDD